MITLVERATTERREASERIKRETEAFLKAGGKIKKLGIKINPPLKKKTLHQKSKETWVLAMDEKKGKKK